jgi:hypothetical protein
MSLGSLSEKDSAPPRRTLRLRGEFIFARNFHRRDAEYAEVAQRKIAFSDRLFGFSQSLFTILF